jgi:GNAT superfamily N-acetyltransferase
MTEKYQVESIKEVPEVTTTPAPDKEQIRKLDQLEPQDLVPAEFANIRKVIGQIKVVARKSDGHIDYIITDGGHMTLQQIENRFTYFDKETLAKYPELKAGKNQYARPLVHGSLSEISPDIIFGGMFETNPALRGKGTGVAFQEHLASLAKKLGYKFLAGYQNDAEIARFFLKRGRYLLEELKDEFQGEFQSLKKQESDETVFCTVKFLNPEDVKKYVKPERVNTNVEDKIEFKEKVITLDNVIHKLTEALRRVEDGKEEKGDRATLIEIMEDLNQILPQKERYNLPELSEDDDNLVLNLKALLEYLKTKFGIIIREATPEQLEENNVL